MSAEDTAKAIGALMGQTLRNSFVVDRQPTFAAPYVRDAGTVAEHWNLFVLATIPCWLFWSARR